ncbi:hypothetical protein DSM107003_26980 [Trichormus variabilis SAG 1403-4b]|uniref:Uncharacterized protein n=1 Tax=Trichormus variabilis SAG 1403-4b TaxID=447716 RepID=A0A433UQC1_ANAVA|nr:hypothetical protein DSM107003_26980 [Trichormus variabilis SAG 1403-4b]
MTELKEIRDDFQNDLRYWYNIGHTFIGMSKIASLEMRKEENLGKKITFATIPTNENGILKFDILSELTYQQMLVTYYGNQDAIAELVYERIIQRWYDFLNQIIEQVVQYHIAGVKTYTKLPKIDIKVDFSRDNFSKDSLLTTLPGLIKEGFDFKKNIEKTELIEKCLEKKIDEELKQEIKKAIITRNLLEHSHGIIREQDVKPLGRNSIKLIDDHCVEKEFKLGEKVEITIYEIFRLNHILYSTSNILIP